jgi:hypothetical protein
MQIDISPATLTRVEGGRLTDIGTFQKLCAWLKVNPAEILDIPADINPIPADPNAIAAAVHLRADETLPPEAAADPAKLIVVAHAELALRNRNAKSCATAHDRIVVRFLYANKFSMGRESIGETKVVVHAENSGLSAVRSARISTRKCNAHGRLGCASQNEAIQIGAQHSGRYHNGCLHAFSNWW